MTVNSKVERLIYSKKFSRAIKMSFVLLTAACVILAVAVRVSSVKPVDDFNKLKNLIIESSTEDNEYIDSQIEQCENNLGDAPVIVTAVFTGDRVSAHYSTLSKMRVTNIIKGKEFVKNKYINVYENNAIAVSKGNYYIRNFTPVNFFNKDKEYLLFLNVTEEFDKQYADYKNISLDEYVMFDYFVSSLCLDDTDSVLLNYGKVNKVDYAEFKSNEFIVFSNERKSAVYELKKNILNKYLP